MPYDEFSYGTLMGRRGEWFSITYGDVEFTSSSMFTSPSDMSSSFPSSEQDCEVLMCPTYAEKNAPTFGWKFFISINHHELAEAWDLIKDVLITQHVGCTKVRKASSLVSLPHEECGKEIVIYAGWQKDEGIAYWPNVLSQIENKLLHRVRANGIVTPVERNPHPTLAGRPIPGSNYISYRNDFDNEAKDKRFPYLSAEAAMDIARIRTTELHLVSPHNPFGFTDPYELLRLGLHVDAIDVPERDEGCCKDCCRCC